MSFPQDVVKLRDDLKSMSSKAERRKGMRHYKLGEFALVGEATVLAIRTNINFNHKNK